MNQKIQAEVKNFVANEVTRRNFMNFYRCIKTLNLLKNLYVSEALPRNIYEEEVRGIQEKLVILKEDLKNYDIKRFCELWKIQVEFSNISLEVKQSEVKLSKGIARIYNLLPQINDNVFPATTYGQIHEIMSNFCRELAKLAESQKNLTPTIKRIIADLISMERQMANKYPRLSDRLQSNSHELLVQTLTKFRIEFDKIYQLF